LWMGRPGLEFDEAAFGAATFPHKVLAYTMHIKGFPVALMVVPYMGALKGWLYIPILKAWPGSIAAIRLPMILLGGVGLYFFYRFTLSALALPAALVALALAATVPPFLFPTPL